MSLKVFIFFLLCFSSFASTTDNLLINGIVPSELSLKIRANNKASNLNLSASPVNLKIATITEKSNSSTGFKITAKSQNGSLLKNGSFDELSYLVSYDGGPQTTLLTSDQILKNESFSGPYLNKSDLRITYSGKPAVEMVEGTYSDIITFTISAN